MFSIPSSFIDQILLPSFLTFLFIGGVFSLLVGIGLIVRSELMFRIFDQMNRWVSLRRKTRALEIPRDCWPLILRYRYALSALITVGAIYSLIELTSSMDITTGVSALSHSFHLPEQFVSWILSSIRLFLLGGCTLGIAVGLMLGFSLTGISKLEDLSKTWISTRSTALGKEANVMHAGLDKFVVSFPSAAGWIITLMSMIEITLVGMRMR
jgi:hypothetical protein